MLSFLEEKVDRRTGGYVEQSTEFTGALCLVADAVKALRGGVGLNLLGAGRVVELEDPAGTLVDRAKIAADLAGQQVVPADEAVAVSVLVDDVLPARLDAMRQAGLSIDGRNESMRVVAGWIQAEKLAALALTDGVKRVDLAGLDR